MQISVELFERICDLHALLKITMSEFEKIREIVENSRVEIQVVQ